MDLIILNDGMYTLVPVTKQMMKDVMLFGSLVLVKFFDLCDILRFQLTTYHELLNNSDQQTCDE